MLIVAKLSNEDLSATEVVHDGERFADAYAGSTLEPWHLVRAGGCRCARAPAAADVRVELRAYAIDVTGDDDV